MGLELFVGQNKQFVDIPLGSGDIFNYFLTFYIQIIDQ